MSDLRNLLQQAATALSDATNHNHNRIRVRIFHEPSPLPRHLGVKTKDFANGFAGWTDDLRGWAAEGNNQ